MSPTDLQSVHDLRVGRVGFGEVHWMGETDVTGVDFDAILSIEHGEVVVYSDTSNLPKPPVGTKLNKPAYIKLENVKPPMAASSHFQSILHRSMQEVGAVSVILILLPQVCLFVFHTSPSMVSVILTQKHCSVKRHTQPLE